MCTDTRSLHVVQLWIVLSSHRIYFQDRVVRAEKYKDSLPVIGCAPRPMHRCIMYRDGILIEGLLLGVALCEFYMEPAKRELAFTVMLNVLRKRLWLCSCYAYEYEQG